MKISIYQIDTFTNKVFKGNPAAVCPLDNWLTDNVMQAIAEENNLSETAFFVPSDNGYEIRWFTPVAEVALCGHATLATAHVLWYNLGCKEKKIIFNSKSGLLTVTKSNQYLTLDFPLQEAYECEIPTEIQKAFSIKPQKCLQAEDYIVVFDDEAEILALKPNQKLLKQLNLRGVIVTAKSESYDFVTRFFAPKYGVNEDPVTGSAYTQVAPYWSKVLGKSTLQVKQLSTRGGVITCEVVNNRVLISGQSCEYMQGEIRV